MLSKTSTCFLFLFTALGAAHSHRRGSSSDDTYGTELDKKEPSVDCVQSPWRCTSCNKENGWIVCTRDILVAKQHYGKGCGPAMEKRPCRVDCKMSPWGVWKPCSKTCGQGQTSRKRHIHLHPQNGGAVCGKIYEYKTCNDKPCDVDCIQSAMSCQPCDKNTGLTACTRAIKVQPKANGKRCLASSVEQKCKVDCVVTPFGEYSECSAKCGGGFTVKKRTITTQPQNGGEECPPLEYRKACNTHKCRVDCKTTDWVCHDCDKETGNKLCTRDIMTHPAGSGTPCGSMVKTKHCKVDCEVDYWRPWTPCSKTCGPGIQTRERKIVFKALYNGKICGALTETKACEKKKCPIDCKQGPWIWGHCDYKTGSAKGERKTLVEPAHHGRECGSSYATKHCLVDCKVKAFLKWSSCTKTCDSGFRWRVRSIEYYPRYGGKKCPGLKEMEICNRQGCPLDCEQSEWVCGDCNMYRGERTCTRRVLVAAKHLGKACGSNEKIKTCRVDCKVSAFGAWSGCSKTCGGGIQTRSRFVDYEPKNGGSGCPPLAEEKNCNGHVCNRNCKQGAFTCTLCDKSTGKMTCTRNTLVYPQGNGEACGPERKEKDCKVDCEVTAFGAFSNCDKACGKGMKTRSRTIKIAAKNGGAVCPLMTESMACNEHDCDRPCQQSENCSTCNLYTGRQRCTRTVVVQPKGKGAACKPANFMKTCLVDCKLTNWGVWSPCTKACGTGTQTRTRRLGHEARNGGKDCDPKRMETQDCNTDPCVQRQCATCPPVKCAKGYTEKIHTGVPCPCPFCEWVEASSSYSSSTMMGAGLAIGGLALVVGYGLMKRRKDDDYEKLFNSVDADMMT